MPLSLGKSVHVVCGFSIASCMHGNYNVMHFQDGVITFKQYSVIMSVRIFLYNEGNFSKKTSDFVSMSDAEQRQITSDKEHETSICVVPV